MEFEVLNIKGTDVKSSRHLIPSGFGAGCWGDGEEAWGEGGHSIEQTDIKCVMQSFSQFRLSDLTLT